MNSCDTVPACGRRSLQTADR